MLKIHVSFEDSKDSFDQESFAQEHFIDKRHQIIFIDTFMERKRYRKYERSGTASLYAAVRTTKRAKPLLTPAQIEALKTASGVVLAILAVVGIGLLTAVAPNLLGALAKLNKAQSRGRKFDRQETEEKLLKTLYYLKSSNLINVSSSKGEVTVSLTEKGNERVKSLDIASITAPKLKTWDGKWWLVAADIPTLTHRSGADLLRKKLRSMEFYPLQRTLWLYPFNPAEALQFIVDSFHIGQYVTLMQVSALDKEDERHVTAFFKQNKIL